MATYGMTQPASHRRMPRNAVIALLLAGTLVAGVGIGLVSSPAPKGRVVYMTTTLMSPWRTHWIDAINRMERQESRVGGSLSQR